MAQSAVVEKPIVEIKPAAPVYYHEIFNTVAKAIHINPVFLKGPAGTGKSELGRQLAEKLGVPFYFTGAVDSEYKLRGFPDAQGRPFETDFVRAYRDGGLFLFDEVDASNPQALLAVNAALANGFFDGPAGRINRHPDFHCIAAANTYGNGATAEYVGRNALDASSIDRYLYLEMGYDEALEHRLAGPENAAWTNLVQRARKEMNDLQIRHVISMRAITTGAKLIKAGFSLAETLRMTVWKGLDPAEADKIMHRVPERMIREAKILTGETEETAPASGQAVHETDINETVTTEITTRSPSGQLLQVGDAVDFAGNRIDDYDPEKDPDRCGPSVEGSLPVSTELPRKLPESPKPVFNPNQLEVGKLIEGEGVYLGIEERTNARTGLKEIWDIYAAPKDLKTRQAIFQGRNLLLNFNNLVRYVGELKYYYGYDGCDFANEQELNAARDAGDYKGGWFIPTREILHGKNRGGDKLQLANLYNSRNTGSFKDTFITKRLGGDCYDHLYCSLTKHPFIPFLIYNVNFTDGSCSPDHKGIELSARLVRAVLRP
jgi:hypothetical protein